MKGPWENKLWGVQGQVEVLIRGPGWWQQKGNSASGIFWEGAGVLDTVTGTGERGEGDRSSSSLDSANSGEWLCRMSQTLLSFL